MVDVDSGICADVPYTLHHELIKTLSFYYNSDFCCFQVVLLVENWSLKKKKLLLSLFVGCSMFLFSHFQGGELVCVIEI